jgi:hypothetical protein
MYLRQLIIGFFAASITVRTAKCRSAITPIAQSELDHKLRLKLKPKNAEIISRPINTIAARLMRLRVGRYCGYCAMSSNQTPKSSAATISKAKTFIVIKGEIVY